MSKRLEEFIKSNKHEFDELEPRLELWDRIEKDMPAAVADMPKKREAKTFSLGFVMRVAATVIVVMSVCFVFYLRSEKAAGVNVAAINPTYAKQQKQYISMIANKRTELKTLAKNDPQLYNEFSKDIAGLDSVYKKLRAQLATSPNQELVLRAMVKNLQVQAELLNQQLRVVEQFNEMKEEDTNEVQSI
jgi:hypothetical protein